jgi:hypothetical protein
MKNFITQTKPIGFYGMKATTLKRWCFGLVFLLTSLSSYGQVSIFETFNTTTTPTGWIYTSFSRSTTAPCDGSGSLRRNFWSSATSGQVQSPTWVSNGQNLIISFDYKIVNYFSSGNPTAATPNTPNWGTLFIEVSTNGGSTYTVAAGQINSTNHTPSLNCANVSYTVPGASLPSTNSIRVRLRGALGATTADYFFYIDNVSINQITTTPPACASNFVPADLATNVSPAAPLTWSSVTGASSYDVYYGTATNPGLAATVSSTSWTPPTMSTNTTYYWKVVPKNANGDATGCSEQSFTTIACPAPTGLVVTLTSATTATVSWSGASTAVVEWGPTGCVAGTDNNAGACGSVVSGSSPQTITGLTLGSSYSINVRQDCSSASNGYSANTNVSFTATAGESCLTAATITVAPNLASATNTLLTTGLTSDGPAGTCSDTTGNPSKKDRWVSFVAPSSGNKVIVSTTSGTITDAIMQVWSSCPTSGVALGCSDDVNGLMPELEFCSLTPGETYYVQIWPYSATATGNFNFRIYEAAPCPVPPANDECAGSVTLTVGAIASCPAAAVTGTTTNATPTPGVIKTSCDAFGTYNDVFYKFNSGNKTTLNITFTNVTGTNEWGLYSGCGTTFLGLCSSTTTTNPIISGFTPNTEYTIVVWANSAAAAGDFSLCISANDNPISKLDQTSGEIDFTNSFAVSGSFEKGGVTPGAGSTVIGSIGVSFTNTNPNTWSESYSWKNINYQTDVFDADSFSGNIGPNYQDGAGNDVFFWSPGVYYYATRFTEGSNVTYGGVNGANIGGTWNGTTFGNGKLKIRTQVRASQNGATYTTLTTPINAVGAVGATMYYFEFRDNADNSLVGEYSNATPAMNFSALGANATNRTYSIRVRADLTGGENIGFGPAVLITLNNTLGLPRLRPTQCGLVVAANNGSVRLNAVPVSGASMYEFGVTVNGGAEQTVSSMTPTFNFGQLPNGVPGFSSTIAIRVRAQSSGLWTGWGSSCNVTTPTQLTRVRASQCNRTFPNLGSTTINANPVAGATAYQFGVTVNGGAEQILSLPTSFFRYSDLPSLPGIGATIAIRVRAIVNGIEGAFGLSCNVFTPAPADEDFSQNLSSNEEMTAYPNPFTNQFTLKLVSNSEASIQIFDINGRLVANQVVNESYDVELGQNLTSGVYLVRVEQNNETKSFKMIKK